MSDDKKFREHPGYSKISARLPQIYLAVCARLSPRDAVSPFKTALGTLVHLYEALEYLESEDCKNRPDELPTVTADDDFFYACDLLVACLNNFDPAETKRNAILTAQRVYDFRLYLSRMGDNSVNYSKSDPRL